MLGGAVTLVRRESISRIIRVERLHHAVAFGFRNDRRSGDAEVKTVALVECVLRHFETGDCACVDEHVLGRRGNASTARRIASSAAW